jgi:hypothetical protein
MAVFRKMGHWALRELKGINGCIPKDGSLGVEEVEGQQ